MKKSHQHLKIAIKHVMFKVNLAQFILNIFNVMDNLVALLSMIKKFNDLKTFKLFIIYKLY